MNLLSEYKGLYLHEIEHSDRLNNRISTCLTVLTILGSGVSGIMRNMHKSKLHIRELS